MALDTFWRCQLLVACKLYLLHTLSLSQLELVHSFASFVQHCTDVFG